MSPDQYLAAATSNTIVLSPQEHRDVETRITDAEATILAIRTELRRVADLKSQLVRKTTELRQLKFAIAPHKQLPDDILREIFSHFVHQGYTLRIPRMSVIEGPWALRQVCSRWREVALGCRFLWDTVYIDSRLPTLENVFRFRSLDTTYPCLWMERTMLANEVLPPTGPINLSLRIYGRSVIMEKFMISHTLCTLIFPNASRIRKLDLDFSPLVTEAFLTTRAPSGFEILTSLSFTRTHEEEHEGYDGHHRQLHHDMSLSRIIGGAPRLEQLSVHDNDIFFDTTHLRPLPRNQLTKLVIVNTSDSFACSTLTIFPFLSQCFNLRSCTLHGVCIGPEEDHSPITLPHLQRLDLTVSHYYIPEVNDYGDGYAIMEFLELPSLVTLIVREPIAGACPLDQLIDLFERSGCSRTLTSLHNFQSRLFDPDDAYDSQEPIDVSIMIGQFDYSKVEDLATLIPNVRDLVLALQLDTEEHLRSLAEADLLPDLERLTFWTATSDLEAHGRGLKDLVRRIKTSGKWRRLEEIRMFVTGDFDGLDEEIILNKDTNLLGDVTVTVVSAFDECDIVTKSVKYLHSN